MDECRISVIVPVYNTEKYLDRCIKSLLNQSIADVDIVLVDDGSTDSSPAICDSYAKDHECVQVIHKQNAGQGLARNDGIKVARGKYIAFLDSDDYYDCDACKRLVHVMEDTGADICSYGYQIDDKDGNPVRKPEVRDREYTGSEVKDEFILHFFGDSLTDDNLRGVSSCMSVFKKSLIDKNGISFPSERVVASEDTAFCLEYCKYASKAVTISDSLYHYIQNESSFSQGYREDRPRLMKAHISMLNKFANEFDNLDSVKDRIAMTAWINLIAFFKQVYRAFDKKEALKRYKEISEDAVIKDALKSLLYRSLPAKQKLLYYAVRNKWTGIVYTLVGIRAKEKL